MKRDMCLKRWSVYLVLVGGLLFLPVRGFAATAINNVAQLQAIQNDLNGDYYLTCDIDASDTVNWNNGKGFDPIGDETNPFTGTFDGNGHTVTNLFIDRVYYTPEEGYYVSLFGFVTGATIKNVGLINPTITSYAYAAALIGKAASSSVIDNCYVRAGTIICENIPGGLVGLNDCSTITNCFVDMDMIGCYYGGGGLCGYTVSGEITNCFANLVSIWGTGGHVGGFAGYSHSTEITNCYTATKSVTANYYGTVGGFMGSSDNDSITNCYAVVDSISGNEYVGGFIGKEMSTGIYSSNYWNYESAGLAQTNDINGSDVGGITGCTMNQMMQETTYNGWNFGSVWEMAGYPQLQWQEDLEEVWRLNCGENVSDFTDPLRDQVWMKDEYFYDLYRWGNILGNAAYTGSDIEGTDLQAVYRTSRWGTGMEYKIEVPDGLYRVKLLFAETYFTAAGQRVFDIALEGVTTWQNVDIYSLAGGQNKAMELSASVTVSDGCLDVTFPQVTADQPCISGIAVEVLDVKEDDFLDFIQKKMFWYFWNEGDLGSGLVKDKEHNWQSGSNGMSSTAINGFALSVYTIGAHRGWVSEQDAYQRVMTMMTTYRNLQLSGDTDTKSLDGFWYHWVDVTNGQRWLPWNSEISTVDSALFIMGALQAGEYFKNTHPDVASLAADLYCDMEWDSFTGIGDQWQQQFVNMGWTPENGYGGDWWNRYCESIFVDLLAFASPDYSISNSAWDNMMRDWVWVNDQDHPFGYYWINCPPLFTHQYHHLYYDLSDKKSNDVDYFANTMIATLANRETCLLDSRYEKKRWGLTACCAPDGSYGVYGGYPVGGHDGTVAPTAAATSMMFTSQESIEALRYMYFKYKHRLWGRYGYSDSFNVGLDWRCDYVDGLNHGAMILGIENYRSGLIKNMFMQCPYAEDGLDLAGFDDTAEVSWSSTQNQTNDGYKAFDSDLNTRWESAQGTTTPQWLERDFKSLETFDRITVNWESAYASAYKILVSNNRTNWTTLYETSVGNGGIDEIHLLEPVTARYLRVYCLERATQWGYSIYEVELTCQANLALEKLCEASSQEAGGEVENAVDGDDQTRWASAWTDNEWFKVDLGQEMAFDRVLLNWETAYGKVYRILVSSDDSNWTEVYYTDTGDGGIDSINIGSTVARYIKLEGVERGTQWGYSLWEFEVSNN